MCGHGHPDAVRHSVRMPISLLILTFLNLCISVKTSILWISVCFFWLCGSIVTNRIIYILALSSLLNLPDWVAVCCRLVAVAPNVLDELWVRKETSPKHGASINNLWTAAESKDNLKRKKKMKYCKSPRRKLHTHVTQMKFDRETSVLFTQEKI